MEGGASCKQGGDAKHIQVIAMGKKPPGVQKQGVSSCLFSIHAWITKPLVEINTFLSKAPHPSAESPESLLASREFFSISFLFLPSSSHSAKCQFKCELCVTPCLFRKVNIYWIATLCWDSPCLCSAWGCLRCSYLRTCMQLLSLSWNCCIQPGETKMEVLQPLVLQP